jgi:hypothetical protein
MHEQIFISGVWWSGAYIVADIANMNGYDLGRRLNSRNDNVFAWKSGPFYSMDGNCSPGSIQDILETKWPFDSVKEEDSINFRNRVIQARSPNEPKHNCCKLSTLSLMTPLIKHSFKDAPIITVIRNGIDISIYESDNYFLRLLMQDRARRGTTLNDIDFVSAIGHLFTAIGDLRWKIQPVSDIGWNFQSRVKPVLWNALYSLRWAMMLDRLNLDIQKHNIQNHHVIKFESLVSQDPEEIEKLQSVLGISGKLIMPPLPKEEVFKYRTSILPALDNDDESTRNGAARILKIVYEICKPYLEKFEYTETIDLFENLEAIK